jgi:eukaryotic-like serine/threonine-protein kinase
VVSQLGQEVEEEDLLAAALALPASERSTYLRRACSTNLDLLQRLTGLLDAFTDATTFIDDRDRTPQFDVERMGPYRLIRELGEGGCGIAYLAEQATPVKRQVAVKVIKPGMDTKAVIARFEAERHVLALLDHPNVAKVFDAGATREGRPYFVMEVVRGIRITEYSAQSKLTISERLSLFIQVCHAIQHAHQKGIIHRDIKPSNVLVTMHDGLALAKVIDFGIAKATQGRLTQYTLHTEIDQLLGTPAYVSPEQTEPTQVAVDTRSDIYSLGVLLYELLTGHTPFDAQELAEVSIERLRERIRTEEPLRPSRRLSSLDDEFLTRISLYTGTTATKLVKQVRDDLDWIVMQCLEKEPSRRYQTVNELIVDLERYLRHEAISARPPSLLYTVRKLARRNRVAFASVLATVTFVFVIAVFAVTMAIQAQRIAAQRDLAERERQRAQKVSNVVLNLFATADPFQTFGGGVSGSALLEQVARSIERELDDQPPARARLQQALGRAYARRGEFQPAIHYLQEAEQTLRQVPGADREVLTTIVDLSLALRLAGDVQGARAALADGEKLVERLGLQRSAEYAKLLLSRGSVTMHEGRIRDAQSDFQKSLDLYRQVVGERSLEVAEVLSESSTVYNWADDRAQAERLAREAVAIFEATAAPTYPDRIRAEIGLAEVLYSQNELDEAAAIFVSAVQKQMQMFGSKSGIVADTLDSLAMVRCAQGRLSEAETLSREAIAAARIAYGQKHISTVGMTVTLARTLFELRKYPEAEATLREALDTFTEGLVPDHQYTASAEYFLGEVLLATKRLSEAEAVLTASMNRWERSGAPHWRVMRSANALGEALYRQGRTKEGAKYLAESLRDLTADPKAEVAAKKKARERAARYLPKSLPSVQTSSGPLTPRNAIEANHAPSANALRRTEPFARRVVTDA